MTDYQWEYVMNGRQRLLMRLYDWLDDHRYDLPWGERWADYPLFALWLTLDLSGAFREEITVPITRGD